MRLGPVHAVVPHFPTLLGTAQLSCEDDIERLYRLLGPLDTRAHHGLREAALEAGHRVADDAEINKRQLPDVEMEIALENALSEKVSVILMQPAHSSEWSGVLALLPGSFLDKFAPGFQIGLPGPVFRSKTCQPSSVAFGL